MKKKTFILFLLLLFLSCGVHADSLSWQVVNYSNPDFIKESGLTIEEFNNLTQSEWLELFNGKERVNFAFSATNSNGEDITNKVNPNLKITLNGSNSTDTIIFKQTDIEKDSDNSDPIVIEEYKPENIFSSGYTDWSSVSYREILAFDGEVETRKNGWMDSKKYNAYLGYNFDEPTEIVGVSLAQGPNIYNHIDPRAKNFEVQYYNEGTWTTAYSGKLSDKTNQLQNFNFSSKGKQNKWRIFIANTYYDGSGYIGLSELKFIKKQ